MNILYCAFLALSLAATDAPLKPKTAKPARTTDAAKADDPVQAEYYKLIEADENALNEIDRWVKEFNAFNEKGVAGPRAALIAKVEQRMLEVKKMYEDFLAKHPNHIEGRLAYGSFLNEAGEEAEAIIQWEKARELDPNNPSSWNNLANIYSHIGPAKKAFGYYEKAMELDPKEPIYVQNLAVAIYLFRKDAAEAYRIDEKQIFDKALELYRQAMKLDPTNLVLATEYAQSYYGIRPLRAEEALTAWNHALTLAKTPVEKQGVYLHLARVQLNSGRFKEADASLALVTHPDLQDMKERLTRNLNEKRAAAEGKPPEAEEKSSKAEGQPAQPASVR